MVTLGDIDPGFGPGDDRRHRPEPGGRMRDSLFWELIMPEEQLGMQIYLYLTDRGQLPQQPRRSARVVRAEPA